MILILNSSKDLKPGFESVALENITLSALTSEAYRVALSDRARVVLLIRDGDARLRILKDLTEHNRNASFGVYITPNVTIMAGQRELAQDIRERVRRYWNRFEAIKDKDPAEFGEPCGWPGEETLRCCADLCEHCAAGFIPIQTGAFGHGVAIVHGAQFGQSWTPCAAAKIWHRVYNNVALQAQSFIQEKAIMTNTSKQPLVAVAKFQINSVEHQGYSDPQRGPVTTAIIVKMTAVYSGAEDPENENWKFTKATPQGEFSMRVENENLFNAFTVGQVYYLPLVDASQITLADLSERLQGADEKIKR